MVRILSTGVSLFSRLLEWYDRNPITRVQTWDGINTVPHGVTDRWTYTVPTGKKAFIESMHLLIIRITAATTVGQIEARIDLTPSGGSRARLFNIMLLDNTVGAKDHGNVGNAGVLQAGDVLIGVTSDSSTAGTAHEFVEAKITEFAA